MPPGSAKQVGPDAHGEGELAVEPVELGDPGPFKFLTLQALGFGDFRGDRRRTGDLFAGNFDDAARVVGHVPKVFFVLRVNDDVERTVAVGELGEGLARDPGAGSQIVERELHARRAGVGREQERVTADLETHERADRGARPKFPVRPEVVFLPRASVHRAEQNPDRAQRGRQRFVGNPRDKHAAVREGDGGDRLVARIACRLAFAHRAVGGSSGSAARENFILSRETNSGWPSALIRPRSETPSGPRPRETAR